MQLVKTHRILIVYRARLARFAIINLESNQSTFKFKHNLKILCEVEMQFILNFGVLLLGKCCF